MSGLRRKWACRRPYPRLTFFFQHVFTPVTRYKIVVLGCKPVYTCEVLDHDGVWLHDAGEPDPPSKLWTTANAALNQAFFNGCHFS